jgi:hypothetical protein
MKHPVELYPDFASLSKQLRNIETLAARMGIDVDDLLKEQTTSLSKRRRVVYMSHMRKAKI